MSVDALAHKVNDEIMACIGCNDCLLACPLPETSIVSIAELNHAVQQPTISAPNVIDFVTACTQCQMCVPVCPADLSRADMVLWNKLKVEDALPDKPLNVQVGEQIQPAPWSADEVTARLSEMPLFANVERKAIRRTLLKSTLRQLAFGETLVEAGAYHERLFVVVDGMIEQTSNGTRILSLGAGSFLGEMAVMSNQAEPFTLSAQTASTLVLEIPKAAVYQLISLSPSFEQMMNNLYARRAIWTHVQQSPVLSGLGESAVSDLLSRAELVTLNPEQILFSENSRPDGMYIVRSGFLKISRSFGEGQSRVLLYFREGDTFGVLPSIAGGLMSFTATANTPVDLIRIDQQNLVEVVDKHPDAKQALLAAAAKAERQLDFAQTARPAAEKPTHQTQLALSWTSLLDQGVMQSHELLVIDQAICTNCNNCVKGCERRHGHSRLDRTGLQLGNLLFPTACRHCEDPVCLLCSVSGIVRLESGEISIVDDNCIGCGACAERCPYDNIQMHLETPPPAKGLFVSLVDMLLGRDSTPERDPHAPHIAVKCDLCAGHNDYACVTACPVGAAFRIDPVEAFGQGELLIGLAVQEQ